MILTDEKCPFCGSKKFSSSLPESRSCEILVTADCDSCKKEWKWSYKLDKTFYVGRVKDEDS